MQRFATTIALLTIALSSWAVLVNNIAGELSHRMTNHDVKILSVSGTMDARDFKYIADSLNQLTVINLSKVDIVAYENLSSPLPLIGNQMSFEAKTIPATSFFGKPLTYVALPGDLKAIGFAAFAGCYELTDITIPESVDSIAGYAFTSTSLSQVNLPANITHLGEGVFSHCKLLTTATVTNSNIPDYAFLGDIELNKVTMGAGVKKIGNGAFKGCTALEAINWESATQLVSVGNEAFTATSIADADLSTFQSLDNVGDWAFAGTPIATAKLPQGMSKLGDGVLYYAKKIKRFFLPPKVEKVGSFLLAGTSVSNNDIMNDDATIIGKCAFYNLSQVQNLVIPAKVDKVGAKAMAGMTGLQLIQAKPARVPELGDSVWAGVNQANVELDAPSATYKTAEQWKEFHVFQKFLLGDANADELVNVGDVISTALYILDSPTVTFVFEAADIDQNNIINVSDITAIINLILNGDSTTIKKTGYVNTNDHVSITGFSIAPGETHTIDINLDNENDYAAIQFDLQLPHGLELTDSHLMATPRSSGHRFTSNVLADGTVRLLGFSADATDFEDNEGPVLHLTLKANNNLADNVEINIRNAIFATHNGETYFGEASKASITKSLDINDLTVKSAKVYAHGQVLIIENEQATTAQLIAINGVMTNLIVEAGHNEYEDFEPGIYMVRIDGKSYKVVIE